MAVPFSIVLQFFESRGWVLSRTRANWRVFCESHRRPADQQMKRPRTPVTFQVDEEGKVSDDVFKEIVGHFLDNEVHGGEDQEAGEDDNRESEDEGDNEDTERDA